MEEVDVYELMGRGIDAYREYFEQRAPPELIGRVRFMRLSEVVGQLLNPAIPYEDLHLAGAVFSQGQGRLGEQGYVDFGCVNERVLKAVRDQQLMLLGKGYGEALTEPAGFALAYGVAGLGFRQQDVDVLMGTDGPGSYLNYLYHAFMDPRDLLVMVPKEVEHE